MITSPRALACTLLLLTACQTRTGTTQHPPSAEAMTGRLKADVTFLAHDDLDGRGTPSHGLDIAALYLETQLAAAGVQPAAGDSYRQFYRIGSYSPAAAKVTVRINGKTVDPKRYVFLNFGWDPERGRLSLPMVEAGTGVVYEEKEIDELGTRDLRGRAVVVRKGAPFALDPGAVFGPDRAMGKVMAATVRGARLLVYLSEELDSGSGAEEAFFREMKNAPVAFIREPGLKHASALNPILVLHPKAYPGPKGMLDIRVETEVREERAANVLGKIPGTDPRLNDEWIVLSAHYDHLGSHPVRSGEDGIWNGADDNASGTAGVLELARQFAGQPGKRSVLVFFTSGEDRGIFGSAYYSIQPVVPMIRVAAQINLDMIGRSEGRVQGIAHASPALFQEAVAAARPLDIEVIPDQQPSWRITYLTDVYHFARAGVPNIEFFTGVHKDYHQPSDSADKIRYEEMARIVQVASALARSYADGKAKPAFERPRWFVTP